MEAYEVRIITNPVAGRDEPFFAAAAAAFGEAGVRWNIDVTNGPGEERQLAEKAVAEGARIVVAYGGDGTVSAVAEALVGTEAVLGIIPGGTGNALARELSIPLDVDGAAKLLAGPHDERAVDLGTAVLADGTERAFILRVAAGIEAALVEESPREAKERLGVLAYVASALKQLPNPPVARYRITAGGADEPDSVEVEGILAVLANSGYFGFGDASYAPDIRIDDGIFDGILVPATVSELLGAAAAAVVGADSPSVLRLSGPELVLESEPPVAVTLDGESAGTTPIRVRVRPAAVRVVVPQA